MSTGTRAPRTIVTINLTGQTEFNIPFEYLARKFVIVTLLGVDRKVLTLNTDYRFVSKTAIALVNPTPAGYTQLELRRETSATDRLVDYHDGSILRAYDLNLSQIQTLHVAEEGRDIAQYTLALNDEGDLDARSRRIVNLKAGRPASTDAANMQQLADAENSTYQNMLKAEAAANEAERQAIIATGAAGAHDISNLQVWNRVTIPLVVGAKIGAYVEEGRLLLPRVSYQAKHYVPVGVTTNAVTVTGAITTNPDGSLTVPTSGGVITFSLINAEAVSRGDLAEVFIEDFGAIGDGVNDDTLAIQRAFDATVQGVLKCKTGKTFVVNSDVRLLRKDQGNPSGGLTVDFSGSKFEGSGAFVVDSCKHLRLVRITAPNMDFVMNSMWFSELNTCYFRNIYVSREDGSSFNASYWNVFNSCTFQSIVNVGSSGHAANDFTFNQCRLRGGIGQGFSSEADYAIELRGNSNTQSWKFYGGDFSYHKEEIVYIDPSNTSDVEIYWDGVYFDTKLPQLPHERSRTSFKTINCHNAIGAGARNPFQTSFGSITGQNISLHQAGRSYNYDGDAPYNTVPFGDMSIIPTEWVGAGRMFSTVAAGQVVSTGSGGFTGNTVVLKAPSGGAAYIRGRRQFAQGKMTACVVLRSKESVPRSVQLGFNNIFDNDVKISDKEWTFWSTTDERIEEQLAGNEPFITISQTSEQPTAYEVEIAYAGIFHGIDAPVLAKGMSFNLIEFSQNDCFQNLANLAPAGARVQQEFTVPGVEIGDFIMYAYSPGSHTMCRAVNNVSCYAKDQIRVTWFNPSHTEELTNLPSGLNTFLRVWKKNMNLPTS